jgi:hypothetical protein
VRFNELVDSLSKEMTKPTLSLHLKHLWKDNKFVIRRVVDAQNVIYQINFRRVEKTKSFKEGYETVTDFMKEEIPNFAGLSIDDQFQFVLNRKVIKALFELKARIEYASDSSNWQNQMLLSLWTDPDTSVPFPETWLIELCKNNKEYREKIFQKIDGTLQKIILPDKSGE